MSRSFLCSLLFVCLFAVGLSAPALAVETSEVSSGGKINDYIVAEHSSAETFSAKAEVLYNTYIDQSYVGIIVQTSAISEDVSEYGVEIDGRQYSYTSQLKGGQYIVDISGLAAGKKYIYAPYYRIGETIIYAQTSSFVTEAAREIVSEEITNDNTNTKLYDGYYYGGINECIAIGYGDNKNYGGFDFIGQKDNEWLNSTFDAHGWAYIFAESAEAEGRISSPQLGSKDNGTVQVWAVPAVSKDGYFGILTFYLRNMTDKELTGYKFGAASDIQIGSADEAPITKQNYGLSMADEKNNTFILLCCGEDKYDTTPVSSLWFGYYEDADENVYNDTADESISDTDSGIAFSWQDITLAPGEIKAYTVALGIGDGDTLNSVLTSGAEIDYLKEKITGLKENTLYKIQAGGNEYILTADQEGSIPLAAENYNWLGQNITIAESAGGAEQELTIAARPSVGEVIAPLETDITVRENSVTLPSESTQEYSIDGGVTWLSGDDSNITFNELQAGVEYEILIRLKATATSPASECLSLKIAINKMFAAEEIIVNYPAETLVYNGSAQKISVTAPDGADVYYSNSANGEYVSSEQFAWFTAAGRHTFYYKVVKEGYEDYYGQASFDIAKAALMAADFAVTSPSNLVYDGKEKRAEVNAQSYINGSGEITVKYYDSYGNELSSAPIDAGEYTVKIDVTEGENYEEARDLAAEIWQFTITQAVNAVNNLTISGWIYGDPAHTPTAAAAFGEISYKYIDTVTNEESLTAPVAAGNYKVIATVAETANYAAASAEMTFAIAPRPLKISWSEDSFIYDGSEKTITPTVTNAVNGDIINLTAIGIRGTKADKYQAEVTAVDNSNYTIIGGENIFKEWFIAKAWLNLESFTVILPDADTFYDGSAKSAVVTAKEGIVGIGSIRVEYYSVGGNLAEAPTDAGEYSVKISVIGGENYEDVTSLEVGRFSIKQAVNEISDLQIAGWVYNEAPNTPTATAKFGEISYKYIGIAPTNYNSTAVPENVGTYKVLATVAETDNYTAATAEKEFAITAAVSNAPLGIAKTDETIFGKNDGTITGVDSSMEYKALVDENYTAVEGTEITGLAAGTYYVRYQATANYSAGSPAEIIIAAGEKIVVTFDTAGGSEIPQAEYAYNEKIAKPAEPLKENYIFAGWFADSVLTARWDFAEPLTLAQITLYAKWVNGTITDHLNGENGAITAEGLNDIAQAVGENIELVVENQAAVSLAEQEAIKALAGNSGEFAFCEISLYKIADDERIAISDTGDSVLQIKLPYDLAEKKNIKLYRYHDMAEEITLLTNKPESAYMDKTAFIDQSNNCLYIYTSKFSAYGLSYDYDKPAGSLVAQRTLTFATNGGSPLAEVSRNYGSTVVLADYLPAKEGYKFAGWYKDSALKEKIEYAVLDYDMTVYAKWTAIAEPADEEFVMVLTIGDKLVLINNVQVISDAAPLIVNARTYTPARFVAEKLGASVWWDAVTRTVTIADDKTTIVLLVDSAIAYVNGTTVTMDAPAFIADGRIYTPARFVAENLGAEVNWDEKSQTVTICR